MVFYLTPPTPITVSCQIRLFDADNSSSYTTTQFFAYVFIQSQYWSIQYHASGDIIPEKKGRISATFKEDYHVNNQHNNSASKHSNNISWSSVLLLFHFMYHFVAVQITINMALCDGWIRLKFDIDY